MILLTKDDKQNIVSSSRREDGSISEREVEERLLILQVRRLTDGLLAHMIIRGVTVDDNIWTQHYLSLLDKPEKPHHGTDDIHLIIAQFKRNFINSIAKKEIKIVSPKDLNAIKIEFSNTIIPFYEESLINEMFVNLNSNLKIYIAKNHLTHKSKIRKYFNQEEEIFIDNRFILGRVSSLTVLWTASFFDYRDELAVSPYLNILINGMHDFTRIVIRQRVIKYFNSDELNEISHKMAIVHELSHTDWFNNKIGVDSFVVTWYYNMRYSIYNFIQQKRTFDEIENEFKLAFDLDLLHAFRLKQNLMEEIKEITIKKIMDDFLKQGIITQDEDKHYHSKSIYF